MYIDGKPNAEIVTRKSRIRHRMPRRKRQGRLRHILIGASARYHWLTGQISNLKPAEWPERPTASRARFKLQSIVWQYVLYVFYCVLGNESGRALEHGNKEMRSGKYPIAKVALNGDYFSLYALTTKSGSVLQWGWLDQSHGPPVFQLDSNLRGESRSLQPVTNVTNAFFYSVLRCWLFFFITYTKL
jgi:hypothetical protein